MTEFDISFASATALAEVREAINRAKARFPQSTEEPIIQEVSAAQMPVVQIAIGGEGVSERALLRIAEDLQRELEGLPEILEAPMVGNREELLEVVVDHKVMLVRSLLIYYLLAIVLLFIPMQIYLNCSPAWQILATTRLTYPQ